MSGIDVAAMREAYSDAGLAERDLAPDWPAQFERWLSDAVAANLPEPNAMVLATADATGRPSARTVLLKGYDAAGFVFYTNYSSTKGTDLAGNPQASLVFPWIALARQVLILGAVQRVNASESDAYWAQRPYGSQVGGAASPQSRPVPDRAGLERRQAELAAAHPDGVPRPEHWGGFRVDPVSVEFWQGRTDRLHDRLRYERVGDGWAVRRYAP